jgi:two-component system, cell cycle response regulator
MSPAPAIPTALRRVLRLATAALPVTAVLSAVAVLAGGAFSAAAEPSWAAAGTLVLVLAGVVAGAAKRMPSRARQEPTVADDLALGAPLVAASVLVAVLAGEGLFPLVYLVMAGLVGFLRFSAAAVLVLLAVGLDALAASRSGTPRTAELASHAVFLALFAATYRLVLNARLALARRAEVDAVRNRLREVEENARTFRLVDSGSAERTEGTDAREKWLLASVQQVEGAVGAVLDVAELAIRGHTCAAFLLDADDRMLRLHDCRSPSEAVQRAPIPAGEGILGGVVRRGVAVRMTSASALRGVGWYESKVAVRSVLAVPLQERSGQLRGVLLADRLEAEAFTDADEQLLTILGREVLRALEVERVLGEVRRGRDEKTRFFGAIEELNRAVDPSAVFAAVLENARTLASLDFVALTLVQEEDGARVHRVAKVTGGSAAARSLEGRSFPDNNGLVANVVRYGAPLPGRALPNMEQKVVFDEDTEIRGLGALRILPLVAADRILGTLVAGTRARGALGEDVLRMLEVLAIQAAQAVLRAQLFEQTERLATTDGLTSLANRRNFQARAGQALAQAVLRAQLFEQTERLATTDGLTSLANRRNFQARAGQALAQARRYGRACAVLITDIDHFKVVNDTYGHPAGDVVLRGVAQMLREQARDTDVVARYGGEEFAVVMPETDLRGAQVIAERLREAVAARSFHTDLGPVRVTLSIGLAASPGDGTEMEALVQLADQCLYQAKRGGRNRVVTADALRPARLQAG